MIVDVKEKPEFRHLSVINADTGQIIPYVTRANDETGEYECFVIDENKVATLEWGNPEFRHIPVPEDRVEQELLSRQYGGIQIKKETRKANIKFIDLRPKQ